MTKAELMKIKEKYHMEFLVQNEITQTKVGLYLITDHEIPELEEIVETPPWSSTVSGLREYRPDGTIYYKIRCHKDWMDLQGWK